MSHDTAGCIGIDEAGRGCLAGPVVAAAVLFPVDCDILAALPGLNDSKQCSEALRRELAPQVRQTCAAWSLGISWPPEIDAVNILNATFRAMARAASRLRVRGNLPRLVIDGNHTIRVEAWLAVTSLPLPDQKAVVDGDALVPSISAASIIAKTFRDHLMTKLGGRWPAYGFPRHKGYGTKAHLEAIARFGPCRMHRATFRGVRREEQQLSLL